MRGSERGRALARLNGFPAARRWLDPGAPVPLRARLLRWYRGSARSLPWRVRRDPYAIWVAEVMLQQTRVAVVVPAYRRFLRAFPDVHRLAAATEERVLAHWSGLGYYTRARALHRAARQIAARGGEFPRRMAEARALPGVGPYVAAAVLSIAYGKPHAAVDANVVRVLSRLACLPRPDRCGEPHRTLADLLLQRRRPGDWNQALMELGGTICLPRAPRCPQCPLRVDCAAHRTGTVPEHPPPRPRRATEKIPLALAVVRDERRRLLLHRGEFPHLAHLWLPPLHDDADGEAALRAEISHSILHRRFQVKVFERVVTRGALARRRSEPAPFERRIFPPRALRHIGRSSLLRKALEVCSSAAARDAGIRDRAPG